MSLFIFSPALLPWFYSRIIRSGFIFWEKWYFHPYIQRVLEKKNCCQEDINEIFQETFQTWWESFYIEWDHSNKADAKNYLHQGRSLWNFRTLGTERKDLKENSVFRQRKQRSKWFPVSQQQLFFFFKAMEQYFQNFKGKQFSICSLSRVSLVIQWLRICPAIQGTPVWSWSRKISMCLGANKPMCCYNYWTHTPSS